MQDKQNFCPNKVSSYFRAEWLSLTFVTLSGLFYNVGLLATPWFEGRLAQCLTDILGGYQTADAMAMLCWRIWSSRWWFRARVSSSDSTFGASPTTSTDV